MLRNPPKAADSADRGRLGDLFGNVRYLMLVAALRTPDPPPLMVLNEPETSLHPELLAPLARLIRSAAERSQVMVVSHSRALIDELGVVDLDDDADDQDEDEDEDDAVDE